MQNGSSPRFSVSLVYEPTHYIMPEISRFFGIVIRMFFDDHNPPHFHAEFQEYRAIIDIRSAKLLDGNFPPKQLKQVQAWTLLYQQELMENFINLGKEFKSYNKIDPLQ